MNRTALLPQSPSVDASLGGTATWDILASPVEIVTSTRHALLVMEYLYKERLTKMWFVSGVPMGRSLIRSPTRTAVGLIQTVMGGLLPEKVMLPQTTCVRP